MALDNLKDGNSLVRLDMLYPQLATHSTHKCNTLWYHYPGYMTYFYNESGYEIGNHFILYGKKDAGPGQIIRDKNNLPITVNEPQGSGIIRYYTYEYYE